MSILTIVAFSIERYLAIYHPLRHYQSGLKRAIRSIFGAWLIALIFAIPFAAYIDINYIEYPQSEFLEQNCTKFHFLWLFNHYSY